METVSTKFAALDSVLNVSMNANYSEVLLVSQSEIPQEQLQEIVSYDEKYKIQKINP